MSKPNYVGKVIDLNGNNLWFTRKYSSGKSGVFQAHLGMNMYLKDVFQTDNDSTATFSFACGGRAFMGAGMRKVILYKELLDITPFYGDLRTDVKRDDSLESIISRTSQFQNWIQNESTNWKNVKLGKRFHIETAGGTMGGLEG